MPLGVVAMGGVGCNSGREGNYGIFPCALFRSLNLDLVLLRKDFTLSTTVKEQMRAKRDGRRRVGLSGFELGPNFHSRALHSIIKGADEFT